MLLSIGPEHIDRQTPHIEQMTRCKGMPTNSWDPPILLTVLATSALGDPHALDRGSPVATADALGPRSRPLICSNGRPSAAAVRLLGRLAETGTSQHTRADDDTAGQEIVKALSPRGVGRAAR
jgi:uncharacterized protein DUF2399